LHQDDPIVNGFYLATDWELQRLPAEYLAIKPYERTVPGGVPAGTLIRTEETWFFLKHTPDGPTECPD
jgi:hypothetical protein